MKRILLNKGKGRLRVSLSAQWIGHDLIVCLFNKHGHIGAAAVADYSQRQRRASTSVITRLGHKDDSVAYSTAHKLCKRIKKPVCAIAGIHLDGITAEEIEKIVQNCNALVDKLSHQLLVGSQSIAAD